MVQLINPKDAQSAFDAKKAILVDVREEDELKETGTVPGSLFVPTSWIEDAAPEWKEFVASLSKDKLVILFCRSGNRSGRVAAKLESMGFQTANMGAFEGWIRAGLPIKKI